MPLHPSPMPTNVVELTEPQQHPAVVSSSSSLPTRKRLRFAPSPVVVEHLSELNHDERRAYWWSPQEVDCMLSKASYTAEESKKNKVLVEAVDQALREARRSALLANHCCINDSSSVQVLQQQQLPPLDMADQGLKLWCQYGHSRRGLEKAVSSLHQTTRNNIVNKARSKVIQLSHQGGSSAQDIRTVYEKASRSSVWFAQMIALADAEAALYPFPVTAERRRSVTHIKRVDSMCSTTSMMTCASLGGATSEFHSPQQPLGGCFQEVSSHHPPQAVWTV